MQGLFPIIIRADSGRTTLDLRNLWRYRDLLYFLAWRDIKVRYKQTALGVIWVVLQPLLLMAIFSIFFGHLAKVPSGGFPYPLFIFGGLLPWQLFVNGVADCGISLATNQNLISKVYFPRLVIPIAAFLPRLVDLVCALFIFSGMMLYFGVRPTWALWTLPFFIILGAATSVGAGLWIAALNLRYRDARQLIPVATQAWFFLSPVAYPSSFVPESWRGLYGLNPMVGVVEGFRWSLLGSGEVSNRVLIISVSVTVILLVSGMYYFRRLERTFADLV
jgi:lipopolysaccharide transport system permease protein